MLSQQVRWEFNDNERLGKLSRKKTKITEGTQLERSNC